MKSEKAADSEADLADETMAVVEAVAVAVTADDKVETEASEIGTVGETAADNKLDEDATSEVRLWSFCC